MSKKLSVVTIAMLLSPLTMGTAFAEPLPEFTSFDRLRMSIPAESGGFINPLVIVGFNPQPEPPATLPANLADPMSPTWAWSSNAPAPAETHQYNFLVAFDLGDRVSVRFDTSLMERPDATNHYEFGVSNTEFSDVWIVGLDFSSNSGTFNPGSLVGFNPQPEPPGALGNQFQAFQFTMTPASPTEIVVSMQIRNAETQQFGTFSSAVPEPSSIALLAMGGLGLWFARRRRAA